MEDVLVQGLDPAALLIVIAAVAFAAIVVGGAVMRGRRDASRRAVSVSAQKRLDVIVRDIDRLAEYVAGPANPKPEAWGPFKRGLAATAACRWDEARGHFEAAQAGGADTPLAPVLNQLGVCLYMQGRLGEASKEFQEAARLAGLDEDKQCQASARNNVGVIRHDQGELDPALHDLREARTLAHDSGDLALEALCLGNIGNVLREKGEHNAALKSEEDALALAREVGDKPGLASCQGNIGSILRDRGEPDKALDQYARGLETARKIGYKLGEAIDLGNIGCLYRSMGDLERAQQNHQWSLALAHEIGYRLGVAAGLGNIGLTMTSKYLHEKAVPYLAESLAFFVAAGAANGPRQTLYGLSKCDDSLGRERMWELLKKAGQTEEVAADTLDRIDQIRSRRPWQEDRQRNPFAPPITTAPSPA